MLVAVLVMGQCCSGDDGDGDVGIVKNHCGYISLGLIWLGEGL